MGSVVSDLSSGAGVDAGQISRLALSEEIHRAMRFVHLVLATSFMILAALAMAPLTPLAQSGTSSKPAPGKERELSHQLLLADHASKGEDIQKALADFRAGKAVQAASELRRLHSAEARNVLGVVLEFMGDEAGALAAFQKALNLQPDFPEASYNVAKLLIREGRFSAASFLLQSAIERHRTQDEAIFPLRLLLGETEAYLGHDKHAADILSVLAAERPNSAEVRFNLALTYARMGSLQEAVQQFHDELHLKPNDPEGLMGLAKALLSLKRPSEAVPYLKEYIRLRQGDAQGYYVLGYALDSVGNHKQAAGYFLHAVQLNPEDYDFRFHLGMALWQSRQLEDALSQFEVAERLKPEQAQVHSALARVYWVLGRKSKAQKENETAEQLSLRIHRNDQASYCIAKGNLLLEHGDLKGAEEEFRQAAELNPENAGARYNLGLVLDHLNDLQGARRQFKEAIALDPNMALADNALGLSYKKEGRFPEAIDAFQQAIRINPQYAEAKNNLGTLYATIGKNDKAAALFEEATEDSPQYAAAYLNWGLLLANQGNLTEAREMLEKALQISPNLVEARRDLKSVNETLKGQH